MRTLLLTTTILAWASFAHAQSSQPLAPGGASVTDCQGIAWSISSDGRVMKGDVAVDGGGDTSAIQLVGCTVWGQDNDDDPSRANAGGWFTLGDEGWTASATPPSDDQQASNSVLPTTPTQTPSDPITPTVPALVATVPFVAVPSCAATAAGTGGFHVTGGQIVGPNGVFVARGINIYGDQDPMTAGGLATQTFKGLNFVRYIVRTLDDPSTYQGFVNLMTSQGIVVEFEHHPDGGGGQDAPYTGAQLANESAWYASMGSAFSGNPYVWFGTFNEPGVGSPGQLSAWHQATYNALRNAGNNNPLLIEPGGSRPWNLVDALVPSVYAAMANVVMDVHVYGYQNDYNSDPTSIANNITGMIAAAQTIQTADGTIPVIIGESGPSTTGSDLDPNGYATVQGLITVAQAGSMSGLAEFTWYPGFASPNNLTDVAGNPTSPYGQMAQLYIGTSVVPLSQCQETAQAAQTINAAQAAANAKPAAQ